MAVKKINDTVAQSMNDTLEIQFLGTGAAVPSARRGLPSIAIHHDGGTILCDMGEGTQMTLARVGLSPSKIHTILFSHLHGDHLFGLPGFLTSQQMMDRSNPITIIGPKGIQEYFDCISKISGFEITYPLTFIELQQENQPALKVGPLTVTALPLEHRTLCYGYRFEEAPKPGRFDAEKAEQLGIGAGPLRAELQQGNSVTVNGTAIHPDELMGPTRPGRVIAYCTDTRPCSNTTILAENSDVLIHDSTFSSELTERAHKTFHTTSVQAAEIAREAKAKSLFLWHLSIRNSVEAEEMMLEEAKQIFPNTYLSQDSLIHTVPRSEP